MRLIAASNQRPTGVMLSTDLAERDFERILIVKPSSLGDVMQALPVLNGLRQRYPKATIAWLVNAEYAPLLNDHPQLNEVIPFDRAKFRTFLGAINMTFKLGGYARELRERRFDLVVDLQGLFRSGLMTFATGSAVRLGFAPAREGAGMFYNHRIVVEDPGLHAVDKNYLTARVLGFDDVPIEFQLAVSKESDITLRQKLARHGMKPGDAFAAIFPGSRWETKNWRPERFSETIVRLHDEHGLSAVVCGSAAEADLCSFVAQSCRKPAIQLAGEIDLPELVALVERSTLVLCNDSAPMHIAAALGKPVVSIFGPTDPRRTGPYRSGESVVRADLPCMPCFYRRIRQCPIQHECMNRVLPDAVLRAVSLELSSDRAVQP